MKKIYLILTALGFIGPNLFVAKVSIQTGNWLLWLDPMATMQGMFGNDISTAFIIDLLLVVMTFFIWTYRESKKRGMKTPIMLWVVTMFFGMACTLPYFLFQCEKNAVAST